MKGCGKSCDGKRVSWWNHSTHMFTYDRELLVPQGCFEIGSSDNSIAHPGDGNPTAGAPEAFFEEAEVLRSCEAPEAMRSCSTQGFVWSDLTTGGRP